jgi:hypothetical protein
MTVRRRHRPGHLRPGQPVLHHTLEAGVEAMVVGAHAWLGK